MTWASRFRKSLRQSASQLVSRRRISQGASSSHRRWRGGGFGALEPLESRNLLAVTTYVDWHWEGLPDGTDPDFFSGPATAMGTDAFSTIQEALDNTDVGGTVIVAPGTYDESLTISSPVTVLGARQGFSGLGPGRDEGNDTVETILDASGTSGGVRIQSSGVTLRGFEILGDASTNYGVWVDAGAAALSGITIERNIVHGMSESDVDGQSYGILANAGAGSITGLTLSQNLMHTIGDGVAVFNGIGVSLSDSDGALIQGNRYDSTAVGVYLDADNTTLTENASDFLSAKAYVLDGSNSFDDGGITLTGLAEHATSSNILGASPGEGIFTSIQYAIDGSDSAATVSVAAGTYAENLAIDRALTLAGAGEGVTTLVPSFSAPMPGGVGSLPVGSSNVILVESDDVTIRDLTVDGDNQLLTSGLVVDGDDLDARNGIITNHTLGDVFDNLVVHDVTMKNIYLRGIYASSGGTFHFHDNYVENVQGEYASIGIFNFGGSGVIENNLVTKANDAIAANWSKGTQFLNNVVTQSGSGVHTDNNGGSGGVADLIQGNQVSAGLANSYGVWVFAPYVDVVVDGNEVSDVDVGLGLFGEFGGSATFTGNTIDLNNRPGSVGAYLSTTLFGIAPSTDVEAYLTGNNTISHADYGIYVEQETGHSAVVEIAGNAASIKSNLVGIYLSGGTVGITGNSIYDNTIGVWADDGAVVSLDDNDFFAPSQPNNDTDLLLADDVGTVTVGATTGNAFAGDLFYIENESSQAIDATSNSFAESDNFRVEDKMSHKLDNLALGLVTWVAGNVFVTTPGGGSTDSSIQRGVDAANVGDTVNIEAGTYAEAVTVNKYLTLDGAGSASTIIQPGADNLEITASGLDSSNRLTLKDLRVEGTSGIVHGIVAVGQDHLAFLDVTSADHDGDGFQLANIGDLVMTDVVATGNGQAAPPTTGRGIGLNGVRDAVLTNVTASGNYSSGLSIGARASSTGNTSNITIDGGTFSNNVGSSGATGINVFLEDGYGASSVTGLSIGGTIVADDNGFAGISLFNQGIATGAISNVDIGQGLGDSVTLNSNSTGGLIVFGNVANVDAKASFDLGDATLAAGAAVLGLDAIGSFSPSNIGVDGSVFTGYTHSLPAITLGAHLPMNLRGLTDVSADDVTINGLSANSGSLADHFAIEDLVLHGVDAGSMGTITWNPGHVYVTTDSFESLLGTTEPSIQRGVDSANSGETVHVEAGTYNEYVVVDTTKSGLTLLGAQAGVNAIDRVGAETTWQPEASPNDGSLLTVQADDVTIDGFTFDGLTTAITAIRNFDNSNDYAIDNLVIQNNIIRDLDVNSGYGIDLVNPDGTPSYGLLIQHNDLADAGFLSISLFRNLFGTIDSNRLHLPYYGIGIGPDLYHSFVGDLTISNNEITGEGRSWGIWANNWFGPAGSDLYITSNTINLSPGVDGTDFDDGVTGDWDTYGINIWSFQNQSTVTLTDNIIGNAPGGGLFSQGMNLWNTTNNATVVGGSIANAQVGINVDSVDSYYAGGVDSTVSISGVDITGGDIGIRVRSRELPYVPVGMAPPPPDALPHGDVGVVLSGGSITGATTGILVQDSEADGHLTTLQLLGGTTITGGTTGLAIEGGADIDLVGDTLADLSFAGQTTYVALSGGAEDDADIDASAATFDGVLGGSATVAQGLAIEDKLFHEVDLGSVGFVELVANQVYVPAMDNLDATPTSNNYRILANVADNLSDGVTVWLSGVFDWTEANALADWATGNDASSGNDDDYAIMLPSGFDQVTWTAQNLGDATIQGPGDLAALSLEGVFVSEFTPGGGDYHDWEFSNLRIFDFDLSIGMFFGAGGSDAFNGMSIVNNHIRVPADLNSVDAPNDSAQNIGIHFAFGSNQTIQGNTIDIEGTGVSASLTGPYASSVGLQSNTSGGSTYNNLLIDGNTITVLGPQSAFPETILGYWENGHGHTANITVSNNAFVNASPLNDPTLNLQRAFRITSHSSASTTVTYSGNQVEGANLGFQWISGSNFAAYEPVVVTGNQLTDVGTGFLVQSNGQANFSDNSLSNSGAWEHTGVGIDIASGSVVVIDDSVASNDIAGFATGIRVAGLATISGNASTISGNLIGIDVSGGSADITGNTIVDNGTGIRFVSGGAGSVSANDFDGVDDNGTDLLLAATAGAVTIGAGNAFAGDTFFIDNQTTQDYDLSANGTTFDETNSYRIEDKMHHVVDTDLAITNGLITWIAGHLFVTDAGTDHSIQRAVDAAAAGNTVNVESAGGTTYTENVSIAKNLTLLSESGRDLTTIEGISGVGALGAIVLSGTTTDFTLGGAGQGFTILGVDNNLPGIENGAVYVLGNHTAPGFLYNDIVANGDHGFVSQGGTVLDGMTFDHNILSGQTFVGPEPADNGFANQFTTPNVPRQLFVLGNGGGTTMAHDIVFTNNEIVGVAGGVNSGGEQGNTLVTLDALDSVITGNTFDGTTTRFGYSLRARGDNNIIAGNQFISATMGGQTADVYVTRFNNQIDDNTFSSSAGSAIFVDTTGGATIGGIAPNTISGYGVGLLLNGSSGTIVLNNSITGNDAGVVVNNGSALLEGNDLTGNTVGLLAQGFAVVDAGQVGPGVDYTGLGISAGGNDFTGYVGPASPVAGAIVNLVSVPGAGPQGLATGDDLSARGNLLPANPEDAIYHDADDSTLGWVDYAGLSNLTTSLDFTTVNEGDTVSLTGSFTNSAQDHLVTIDWGDGTIDVFLYPSGDFSISETHTYADDNPSGTSSDTYAPVQVTVEEVAPGTELAMHSPGAVTVNNVDPMASILGAPLTGDEGATINLGSSVSDPGDSAFTYFWSVTKDLIPFGATGGSPTYSFTPDDEGVYEVSLTVSDDDLGSHTVTATITVGNVAPSIDTLTVDTTVVEGGSVTLAGTYSDQGPIDSHELEIDWDGDSVVDEVVPLSGGSFSISHTYADDDPTGTPSDLTTIQVRLVDFDGGEDLTTIDTTVVNADPVLGPLSVDLTVDEGGSVTLTGVYADDGANDTHSLSIDWDGDAIPDETVAVSGGAFLVTHTYADDNPTGTSFDLTTISVTITDDDTGADTHSTSTTVQNVAPSAVAIVGAPVSSAEGASISLTPSFTDPAGSNDTYTYAWSVTKNSLPFASQTGPTAGFTFTPDDNGTYEVFLTVSDDDLGSGVASSATIAVTNVAPTIALSGASTVNEASVYTLTLGAITDPGSDTVSQWIVNWGDGNIDTYLTGGNVTHTYADGPALRNITVSLFDEDGLHTNAGLPTPLAVTVNNVAPTASFANAGPFDEGSTGFVLFFGQDDVATPDDLGGFTYSYDFNNDGDFLDAGEIPSTTSASATVPAIYLADGPAIRVVRGRIRDKDGGFTDYLTSITVNNVAPIVNAGPDATVGISSPFVQAGSFTDPGADTWTATVDYDDGNGVQPLTLSGHNFTLNATYPAPGIYNVVVTVTDDNGGSHSDTVVVTVVPVEFQVTGLTPNPSGFDVTFNRAADMSVINLYDGVDLTADQPDVVIVGTNTGPVRGSLVWDASTNTARFVRTGGVLLADTYTVTLVSASDAWKDGSGSLLDGNYDNMAGNDFTTSFTIGASSDRVLSLPDFTRGPHQAVDVPATSLGLPIRMSDMTNVGSIDFDLVYDPTLLTITAASLSSSLPPGWSITSNLTVPGLAEITISTGQLSALTSGAHDVVVLTAEVPGSAQYGLAEVLEIENVFVGNFFSGSIATKGDRAVHKAAFLADADGSGAPFAPAFGPYDGNDAALISRVVVNLDTGFDAHDNIDPAIVANSNGTLVVDLHGEALLDGQDASFVAQKSVGLVRPEIPDWPLTPVSSVPAGIDPLLEIADLIPANAGASVVAPVTIDNAENLLGFNVRTEYDTSILNLLTANVALGNFFDSFGGWTIIANADDAIGQVNVSLFRSTPMPMGIGGGEVTTYGFDVLPTAPEGITPLDVSGVPVSGGFSYTHEDGSLLINHAPTIGSAALTFSGSTSVHPAYTVPTGDGDQLRTIPVAKVDTISISFPEHVNVSMGDLTATGTTFGAYAFTSFNYNPLTFTATWTLTAPIDADKITLVLSDNVTDADGAPLDGEWDNPTDLNDPSSSTTAGDGIPGGDFEFHVTVLPGDANLDNAVDGADFTIWGDHFDGGSGPADKLFTDGDFTGDGHADGADFTIWADHFGLDQTAPLPNLPAGGTVLTRPSQSTDVVSAVTLRAFRPAGSASSAGSRTTPAVDNAPRARGQSTPVHERAVDKLFTERGWLADDLDGLL